MMKKTLALLLAALMMCLAFAACSSEPASSGTESDVEYIKEKGTLVVGITNFAPMDYLDENGEWIGFDADMARKVAEALGVEVEFIEIEWGNKLIELENKSVDCLWNGMTITDEITNGAAATNPYAKNAQVVVKTAENAANYTTAESVAELFVAVESGSAGEAAANDAGFANLNSVTSQADALMEVAAGTSDACVIDLLMAGAMIGEGTSYPDLVITELELTEEDYGVGCRKGSDLVDFINEQFVTLYEDGTMMELAEEYGIAANIVPQS